MSEMPSTAVAPAVQGGLAPCPACDGEGVVHNGSDWVDCYECKGTGRRALPALDFSRFDETDWHVLAQDISHHWSHPEEVAVAYQAAAEAIKILRAEMERRDRNETRNCLNWGPCSRHDGRMAE